MKKVFILLIFSITCFISCGNNKDVDLVKNGHFGMYPDITVGEIIDKIFEKVKWKKITKDKKNYISVTGVTKNGKEVEIKFHIHKNKWEIDSVNIDNKPVAKDNIERDLYDIYRLQE